ncbi:MAG: caspase family protein [Rubrivivax sp.]|nr:caspase family protein [Rubrivivax sp.]
MKRLVRRWVVVLAGLLPAAALVQATRPAQPARPARVALVIGNAAYATAPLPNPVHDARDMAKRETGVLAAFAVQ